MTRTAISPRLAMRIFLNMEEDDRPAAQDLKSNSILPERTALCRGALFGCFTATAPPELREHENQQDNYFRLNGVPVARMWINDVVGGRIHQKEQQVEPSPGPSLSNRPDCPPPRQE